MLFKHADALHVCQSMSLDLYGIYWLLPEPLLPQFKNTDILIK
jgi:hypothetical protein